MSFAAPNNTKRIGSKVRNRQLSPVTIWMLATLSLIWYRWSPVLFWPRMEALQSI